MGLTAKELLEQHPDTQWRRKFVDITNLLQILADCIISDDYSIADELNSAVALSPKGISLKDRLIRRDEIPVKEAHLMCALTVGHKDIFIDIDATDVDQLRDAINKQLLERRIRFPYSQGRTLYDSYGALFEDEKDVLTVDETFKLLNTLPFGVYQYGTNVLGPYGIMQSRSSRSVQFDRRVPAFHCSKPTCYAVHPVRLTTSYEAKINGEREKLHKYLDQTSADAADWWGLALEIVNFRASYYGDHRSGTLAALIGDCLSDAELNSLLMFLLDETKGSYRNAVEHVLPAGRAEDMIRALARPEMMQLVLVAEESWLAKGLDKLVRNNLIIVPKGEIRRPVTNRRSHSGAFDLVPELGHHGVRFVSSDPGLASLRERKLLDKLYLRDSGTDTEELDWQLRGFDSDDLDERLENFFRSTDPRAAIKRMVLARKTNMIAACEEVGIEDGSSLSDDALVETILWKLGFDVRFESDPHKYFWDLHQRISVLTQSSRISGIGESETFRGVASSFFTELEGILTDSLAFSTWVLLNDHTSSSFPFAYDNEMDRFTGFALLQEAHEQSPNDAEQFQFNSDRHELFTLIRGFGVLGKELERLQGQQEYHRRPADEFPSYDGKTELKTYLFARTIPFLNLTISAQERLKSGLAEISALMVSVEVNQVRNDYSHYRRTSPEIDKMAKALDAVGSAVRVIENLGLARLLCSPTEVQVDAWGRSRHKFAGPRSTEYMFARPSRYDWMGLPGLYSPQFIVRSASFAEPNEVLRITQRFDSDFSRMWSNYPSRRQGSIGLVTTDEVEPHANNLDIQRQASS
ncbi:hypothetical protein [Clavibacter michiganensis]|uniref:Uncharacterized protein n=1 Tax=Clavibacter michiganensis subsp. michiganensis (strain NCPPB 382) TaxID=443906 RepID=A5CV48_CLAM3|nr:hypothetical protein [Clavibacter michiganensis]CAN02987.1 hypothetical protein CMM_2901 [Clavibacter michiganensis subsp. michiganensis NCPPB 382]